MHEEQRDRTDTLLREAGIRQALFADSLSITWLTGYTPAPSIGPSPFAGGPALLWYDEGAYTLIVLAGEVAASAEAGYRVMTYEGYTVDRPMASAGNLVATLRAAIGRPPASGTVGVELGDLPALLWLALRDLLPSAVEMVPIDDRLVPLRTVKTAEELALLRRNFQLIEVGHAAARRSVRTGMREIDVWAVIQQTIDTTAGCRVPLGNDCVAGYRQGNMGGPPQDLALRPHDSLVVDLSTRLGGYWSDSCATYYADGPTPEQIAMHTTAAEALELAISLVRPGAVAREIDRQVRAFIERAGYPVYPHHTGHSVGVSGHEEPRIVPYSDWVLEPGMVIMLEPGIYLPGKTAVRLEDAVLVTSDGVELLTHHDKSLP